jgi:hypothetical protein
MNPAVIESYLITLADEIVAPSPVSEERPNYRLQSVRAALLVRLGRCYGIPRALLMFDLDVIINKILDERSAQIDQERRDEIAHLEDVWNL